MVQKITATTTTTEKNKTNKQKQKHRKETLSIDGKSNHIDISQDTKYEVFFLFVSSFLK